MIDEQFGVRAFHGDFTHVRDVEHADTSAYRFVFLYDACVLYRHVETAERAHDSSGLDVA